MKKVFSQHLGYKIGALFLAILLFIYVKTDHLSTTRTTSSHTTQQASTLLATKTISISMPVDLDINSDKYIVSGYQEDVKVKLSGSAALLTAMKNTRNFKVYLDLNDLGAGKHTVKYKVDGLNKDIKYEVLPESANVTISKRESKTFDIRYQYDENLVKDGYVMGDLEANVDVVHVTGSASEIKRIAQVVANINIPSNSKKDIHAKTVLQALDESGHIVDVLIDPESVNVTIPITKEKSSNSESSSESSKNSSQKNSQSEDSSVSDN